MAWRHSSSFEAPPSQTIRSRLAVRKKGEPQAISVGQGGEMLQEMLEQSNRKEVSRSGLGLGAL